ncbi:hypothetical protein [Nocardioides limicola]|uniref:hypothetical protein n=1 Tax=Nocardioides limicola TaxID=2803368 RepID=UPI00193B410F|nr:hypothetical protein [Nocardioides sp. DJM-14]
MFPTLTFTIALFLAAVAVLSLLALAVPAVEEFARMAMRVGQLAVVAVVALDVVMLLQGHQPPERTTHIGYAVAAVGLPVLLLSRRPEAEGEPAPKPHLAVVAVTAAATCVMLVRLQQTLN